MSDESQDRLPTLPTQLDDAIVVIRSHRVMLDATLADLYGVATKVLVQAVHRNRERFPSDFMFQLTADEFEALRSQTVTSKQSRGGRRYSPYVFTEQGVAMLSSVLRSERAVRVNIEIMRAFVRLRQMLAGNADLSRRLDDLEQRYDHQFGAVFEAIRQLMAPALTPKRQLGFRPTDDSG
jgi:hypothetical protein